MKTTRHQYGGLVAALSPLILRHALEAHRHHRPATTSLFSAMMARQAAKREITSARHLLESLRDNLHPADFRELFLALRRLYRQRLAAEREADRTVAAQQMQRILAVERVQMSAFAALCRAA